MSGNGGYTGIFDYYYDYSTDPYPSTYNGKKIGILVGVLVPLGCIIFFLVLYCIYRYRRRRALAIELEAKKAHHIAQQSKEKWKPQEGGLANFQGH
jgi:hypothetical protein